MKAKMKSEGIDKGGFSCVVAWSTREGSSEVYGSCVLGTKP